MQEMSGTEDASWTTGAMAYRIYEVPYEVRRSEIPMLVSEEHLVTAAGRSTLANALQYNARKLPKSLLAIPGVHTVVFTRRTVWIFKDSDVATWGRMHQAVVDALASCAPSASVWSDPARPLLPSDKREEERQNIGGTDTVEPGGSTGVLKLLRGGI